MARIYVGNLPLDIRTRDIEDLFFKYGRIRDIDLKTPARPPAFAFVSFEHYEDARDAVDGRDGVQFEGARLRVEMSRGGGYDGGGGGGGGGRGYDDRGPPRGRDYGYDDRRGPPPRRGPPRDLRRSEHRVIVSGLPPSASWQDLKDFFRQAGDVIFTDVDRHGGGIVEFANKSDQEYAISKLDDTEFVSEYRNQGEKAYIRVKKPRDQMTDEEREADSKTDDGKEADDRKVVRVNARKDDKPRDRSRDRDRKASRSRSRSPKKSPRRRGSSSRSRSRGRNSRSRSPARKEDKKKGDDRKVDDKEDDDKKED